MAEHECPAVVYNAMAAETGEPLLFSTVGLPPSLAAFDFSARYPGRDIPVTTAVRLSSTFPYVSPAARADADDANRNGYIHVVDGGYFDNYGISSLAAIVDAALTGSATHDAASVSVARAPAGADNGSRPPASRRGKRRLLVVEICDAATCSGDAPPAGVSPGGKDREWPYQIKAPLTALIATRSAAQRAANRNVLQLLEKYWRTQSTCIESLSVPFGSDETPMSWHLTTVEKTAVDQAWANVHDRTTTALRAFLDGGAATDEGRACLADK